MKLLIFILASFLFMQSTCYAGLTDGIKSTLNKAGEETKSATKQASTGYSGIKDEVKDKIKEVRNGTEAVVQNATSPKDFENDSSDTLCFAGLGCFPNTKPWKSVLRPFPEPKTPDEIDVKFYLYTKKDPQSRYTVFRWPNISLEGSDFNAERPYTAFITHGFSSNGNVSWVNDLKDAYLKVRDANVFIVDWGNGASTSNYLQVGANTRVVGAELKELGNFLVEKNGLDPQKIHMMGHSLGSHISAYMAKAIKGVAHITAFDPAQPGFEANPETVRLSKNDADFVEALHTNAQPFIPFLGFGYIAPIGHVDFYMNGGLTQPGCVLPPLDQVNIKGIDDLAKYPVDVISSWVSCSHGRSYLYYTEALLNNYCRFWGRDAGILGTTLDVTSLGKAELLLDKISSCNLEKCVPIGLDVQEYPARGAFSVLTYAYSPFCQNSPKVTEKMIKLKESALESNGTTKSKSVASKVVGKLIG